MSTVELTPEEARERLAAKAKERKERIEANHEKALGVIQSGDEAFGDGRFSEALELYSEATLLWNTNVNVHVKLATTLVKCKQYEQAAIAATRALYMEPSNTEARYQRGLARLEQHKAGLALVDLGSVLEIDLTHSRAARALEKAKQEYNRGKGKKNAPADNIDAELASPWFMEDSIEEVDLSDSEDSRMVGNGVPCRHYNKKPAGCREETNCKWMHAPDDNSVRDTTGRNVCVYHLFDLCKFGDKCFYSHDKEWLPPNGWWTNGDDDRVTELAMIELARREDCAEQQRSRKGKKSSKKSKKKKGGKKRKATATSGAVPAWMSMSMNSIDYELDDDDLDDYDYRMLNLGFSQGDIEELMCQGIKPWDDDARGVLDFLSSY